MTVSGPGLTTGSATQYAEGSWAGSGAALADGNNTCSATATDTASRTAVDSASFDLPATNAFTYDFNGNLTNDGRRVFEYDFPPPDLQCRTPGMDAGTIRRTVNGQAVSG